MKPHFIPMCRRCNRELTGTPSVVKYTPESPYEIDLSDMNCPTVNEYFEVWYANFTADELDKAVSNHSDTYYIKEQ